MISTLVELLLNAPWRKIKEGKVYKYSLNQWNEVPAQDRMRLSQTEAQVWLALYNMLLDEEIRKKYTFTEHSKATTLKVLHCCIVSNRSSKTCLMKIWWIKFRYFQASRPSLINWLSQNHPHLNLPHFSLNKYEILDFSYTKVCLLRESLLKEDWPNVAETHKKLLTQNPREDPEIQRWSSLEVVLIMKAGTVVYIHWLCGTYVEQSPATTMLRVWQNSH